MESAWGSLASSSLSLAEKLCAAFFPVILVVDAVVYALARCCEPKQKSDVRSPRFGFRDIERLAEETEFSVNEVEALNELFKKLSRSIIDDGSIHKEELRLALFKTPLGENLFLDRVFDLFDQKRNGVIDFEEFVRSLNVFHPQTSPDVKQDFSFKLYDLRQTGFIEREEVEQMVAAILKETNLDISDEVLQHVTNKTFQEADADKDGKINKEDWKAFVKQYPSLLNHMTLPYLRDVTARFPSFIFNTEVKDPDPA